ncbi:DUF72 domain-containing protein [Falsiroseomonas sp. HW251]|uniref:DUF72 domain-containing protein n=1 Tax=Falsiroseomonas sp. HW251 TaxID=3390998 RepID=UPI003D3235A4
MTQRRPAVGTAGWSIPKQHAAAFPDGGTHLERYARRFPAVEINSSFYRSHKRATYVRWAASVAPGFRFAVKVPKAVTHERRLRDAEEPLERFLGEAEGLGDRLGPLLVQLPPSLRHDRGLVDGFFGHLRRRFAGELVCEPRHATWFAEEVEARLSELRVARVAADPAVVPSAGVPGGWPGVTYRRLHGSPEMYRSGYAGAVLDELARQIRSDQQDGREAWCIFDNTALGEATRNALDLVDRL